MKRKVVSLISGVLIVSFLLTGCGAGADISTLNKMQALNSESSTNDYNLSLSEKQSLVYAQVTERSLLDLSTLDACSDTEVQQVTQYMDEANKQLTGEVSADNGVIDEGFTNYLLWEFEKSPYYWQRTRTGIRGIDSKSRSIIVDVDYSTIGFKKELHEDSHLVKGKPNYDKEAQVRHERWIRILRAKYSSASASDWQSELQKFEKAYGKPEEIFKEQRNLGLTEETYETGNQRTYNGVSASELNQKGGSMTVRYILVPNYVLGINLGMDCKHMYITSYNISEDPTEGMELFKDDGYATISDNVYKMIDSYFKCIDEADMRGLYKLTDNFAALDKYYQDMSESAYSKHSSFTVSLFDITGTKITCGVQVSSKIRAKGSNMSMPSYTDRYYVELGLIDEQLKVTQMTLLSRKLEGEPTINTEESETSGFDATIDLSSDARVSMEKLICDFGALQLSGDNSSDKFSNLVDYSMSEDKLIKMKEDYATMQGGTKVVYIENYQQGTTNYASIRCRELHQGEDKKIKESDVTYEFILKGEKWYIYGYTVNSSTILNSDNLTTSGSLCLLKPDKVEAYTSQVSTDTASETEGTKEKKVDSIVIEHPQVEPPVKNGSSGGAVMLTVDLLVDSQFEALWSKVGGSLTVDQITSFDSSIGVQPTDEGSMTKEAKRLVCISYNKQSNAISSKQFKSEMKSFKDSYNSIKGQWSSKGGSAEVIQAFDNAVSGVH